MPVIIGFDTEYTRHVPEFTLSETDNRNNRVLSYQLWFLDTETGCSGGLVIPIQNGHKKSGRMTLASLLTTGIEYAKRNDIIKGIPDKVILTAHFWRADLPALRDFPKLKRKLDTVRNTYVSAKQPFVQKIRVNGRPHKLSITMVDTMLLAPAKFQSLANLGELLGVEKIVLPEGMIETMDVLQTEDPELFDRYALRDAEISAKWVQKIMTFFDKELGIDTNNFPITLGSAAVKTFTAGLEKDELEILLGGRSSGKVANSTAGWIDQLSDKISFCANCYHGGRNEAYAVGYHRGHFTDIDLSGAYTTAMAAIKYPDWQNLEETTDIDVLARSDALCIARVGFCFPEDVRFPSLPVRAGDYGLIYPMEGVSYCTGAELVVAINQGALIKVENGLYVPWLNEDRPFAAFTDTINTIRSKFKKGSAQERAAKEIGNSLYGKIAQGVANMRGNNSSGSGRRFSGREGVMKDLEPSKITQPLLAAYITGLTRAVLSEMLANLPQGTTLISATTDGFLSDVDFDALDMNGPLISLFSELRSIVSDSPVPVEVKAKASEVLSVKTRGCFATEPIDSENPGHPILARAGNKLNKAVAEQCDDPWQECREWENIHNSRTFETKHTRRQMIDLRSQWQRDADLTDQPREVRVNLEYDLKRRPVLNVTQN
ncbi:MAG: DNA polymerase [Hyphomicrobiales bacterium]